MGMAWVKLLLHVDADLWFETWLVLNTTGEKINVDRPMIWSIHAAPSLLFAFVPLVPTSMLQLPKTTAGIL